MSPLYDSFLALLSPESRVLDAGAGSGRDLREFVRRGYRCRGIDASPSLARLAHEYSSAPCDVQRIEELNETAAYDGIWACASLLHLPKEMIVDALARLHRALVPLGVLFASVQEGEGVQVDRGGRFFAMYTPSEFLAAVTAGGFAIVRSWTSEDVLRDHVGPRWINVLAKARPSASS
ncbi:Methyltransferase domain protein [compost metagenome]